MAKTASSAGAAGVAGAVIDAYIAKSKPFAQPILTHLRELIHAAVPEVEEAMKWSMPFFLCRGIILANIAGFKEHCSFGIWKEQVQPLMKDGGGGMGSFGKVKSLADLPSDAELKALLIHAADKIMRGERTVNWERPAKPKRAAPELPEALAAAFKKNKPAAAAFKAMSASCQREYCEWIAEAKRDETRNKRVATTVEWIAKGKSRNWKYENC